MKDYKIKVNNYQKASPEYITRIDRLPNKGAKLGELSKRFKKHADVWEKVAKKWKNNRKDKLPF